MSPAAGHDSCAASRRGPRYFEVRSNAVLDMRPLAHEPATRKRHCTRACNDDGNSTDRSDRESPTIVKDCHEQAVHRANEQYAPHRNAVRPEERKAAKGTHGAHSSHQQASCRQEHCSAKSFHVNCMPLSVANWAVANSQEGSGGSHREDHCSECRRTHV